MNSTNHPPSGLWRPSALKYMYYGEDVVRTKLEALLPNAMSRAAIITGTSLKTKTPLVDEVETLLGPTRHALTYIAIKAHAPVADLEKVAQLVHEHEDIDTLISIGGGSPIDAAKWVSIKVREMRIDSGVTFSSEEGYLTHISIPTTLSAAECTAYSAFTNQEGEKVAIGGHSLVAPTAILYDPHFASYTPLRLWLASGIRALDHAIELMYHPSTSEVPCKEVCMSSVAAIFQYLPKARWSHDGQGTCDAETTIRLFLAAFGSLQFLGGNVTAGLGLSHSLGHAMGATYGIPHGETSCLALGHVIKLKARRSFADAEQIARLLPFCTDEGPIWQNSTVMPELYVEKALMVGDAVMMLVERLELKKPLSEYGVSRDEVDNIVNRALGGHVYGAIAGVDEEFREEVKRLVEGLFDWNHTVLYQSLRPSSL